MQIGGYQKLTLIDYPGKLATTVFTAGCSFRCPFCHNPELVRLETYSLKRTDNKKEQEFFEFLKKRQGKLEGVCITGGEPTIQPDIIEFIKKIKDLGYLVKLDSNGSRPEIIERVLKENLADFIAMDIKNSPKKYVETTGGSADWEKIKKSVDFIINSSVDYEFRTTVVPGIHNEDDFWEIADWIGGAKAYWLQEYRETKILDPNLKNTTAGKKINLEKIKEAIKNKFGLVGIRS